MLWHHISWMHLGDLQHIILVLCIPRIYVLEQLICQPPESSFERVCSVAVFYTLHIHPLTSTPRVPFFETMKIQRINTSPHGQVLRGSEPHAIVFSFQFVICNQLLLDCKHYTRYEYFIGPAKHCTHFQSFWPFWVYARVFSFFRPLLWLHTNPITWFSLPWHDTYADEYANDMLMSMLYTHLICKFCPKTPLSIL